MLFPEFHPIVIPKIPLRFLSISDRETNTGNVLSHLQDEQEEKDMTDNIFAKLFSRKTDAINRSIAYHKYHNILHTAYQNIQKDKLRAYNS